MPALQFAEFGRGQPGNNTRNAELPMCSASATTTLVLAVLIEDWIDETERTWFLSQIVSEH
jgi:hypothetical protein